MKKENIEKSRSHKKNKCRESTEVPLFSEVWFELVAEHALRLENYIGEELRIIGFDTGKGRFDGHILLYANIFGVYKNLVTKSNEMLVQLVGIKDRLPVRARTREVIGDDGNKFIILI